MRFKNHYETKNRFSYNRLRSMETLKSTIFIKIALLLSFTLIYLLPLSGQENEPLPLFQDDDLIEFKLVGNFNKLFDDVGEDRKDYPAKLIYKNPKGEKLNIEMELKTRGNFRRNPDNCSFPPIRLDFDGERSKTIFQGQGKVKLVTHCLDKYKHENVQKEYLVYKLYNLLTPYSFQVRLCRIKYRQSWSLKSQKNFAFIIEDNDDMADRFGGKELDEDDDYMPIDSLALAHLALFSYMIGNTDWAVKPLKNMEILKISSQNEVIPVPYDFDLSAFVNAPYAPDALFIDSARFHQRKYKGPEFRKSIVEKVTDNFLESRQNMFSLIRQFNYLSKNEKNRLVSYLKEFYREIKENPYREEWTQKIRPGN